MLMNGAGNHLFAGTGGTDDHHPRIGLRHLVAHGVDLGEHLVVALRHLLELGHQRTLGVVDLVHADHQLSIRDEDPTELIERRRVDVTEGEHAHCRDGAVRTVRGAGEASPSGNGDLHINIKVTDHGLFTREGADILISIPISFPQAVLGASIDVPTLDGKVLMKVPAGTQSGKVFRLRGKGISVYGGYGKGDQLVTVIVEVPQQISRRQRKLITELAQEIGDDAHPQQASFLRKFRGLFDA